MAIKIRFTKAPAKPKPKKPKQSGGKKATLNKLNSFLKQEEPKTVEILVTNLHAQGNSVTYKELREAYLAGGLTEKQFTTWQKKYSKLVEDALKPEWEKAAALAAQEAKEKYPYFLYEPGIGAAADWIKQHGAELVTNLAADQVQALNAIIGHVSGYTAIAPDEAARIMRPCIGLTKPQALANARYREAVKEAYLKAHPNGKPETAEKKAQEAAARYAARQHRYRAQSIARTELAYGYNAGAYGATKDAQAQGYIGDCVKVWVTAYDERVCPICSQMDEEKRNMDEMFSNGKLLPPGHPQCRCAVAYEEIEGTNIQPQAANSTAGAQAQSTTAPAGRTAGNAPASQPALVKTEGGYKVSEVLDDMSVLPRNQNGVAIHSDGSMLEQMNLTGRRVTVGGSDYYEISGKLTEETWEAAAKNAKQRGYSSKMDFLTRNADGTYSAGNVGMQLDANRIMTLDQSTFEIYSDYMGKEQYSMGGFFRIRVPATGNAAADRKAMEEIIDKAGLRSLTVDPTDAEELLLKKTRIAWQRDPAAFEKCRYLKGSAREQEIDKILAKAGLDDKRIQGMTLKEVFPGYSTYVDDAALMEYKKAGLTHVWAGVDNADSVVAICKSDGFTATNYRITAGMKKCGASPGADMKSGGADNVFTRLGCKVDMDYQMSFLGEDYRVIISPEVMNRTDWYAHRGDSYGVAKLNDSRWKKRLGTTDFIKSETGSKYDFTCDNEILFRHGIGTDQFVGISCQDERRRQVLLEKFRDAGVTEFNGVPIDEFVTVTKKVGEDSMRGVQGLSYYDKDVPF